MQNTGRDPAILAGRILLGLLFVLSGFGEIGGFNTQAAIVTGLFTLLAAFIVHAFWTAPEARKTMQQVSALA